MCQLPPLALPVELNVNHSPRTAYPCFKVSTVRYQAFWPSFGSLKDHPITEYYYSIQLPSDASHSWDFETDDDRLRLNEQVTKRRWSATVRYSQSLGEGSFVTVYKGYHEVRSAINVTYPGNAASSRHQDRHT